MLINDQIFYRLSKYSLCAFTQFLTFTNSSVNSMHHSTKILIKQIFIIILDRVCIIVRETNIICLSIYSYFITATF